MTQDGGKAMDKNGGWRRGKAAFFNQLWPVSYTHLDVYKRQTYSSVGIYTYTITENAGNNAGVTYYGDPIRLVVTVQQGADNKIRVAAVHTEKEGGIKSHNFENKYSAGSLQISKTVTGNMGDRDKYFKVTVTLTGESGKTYAESYNITGGSTSPDSTEKNPSTITVGKPVDIYLKHGDTVTISNPVSYTHLDVYKRQG